MKKIIINMVHEYYFESQEALEVNEKTWQWVENTQRLKEEADVSSLPLVKFNFDRGIVNPYQDIKTLSRPEKDELIERNDLFLRFIPRNMLREWA